MRAAFLVGRIVLLAVVGCAGKAPRPTVNLPSVPVVSTTPPVQPAAQPTFCMPSDLRKEAQKANAWMDGERVYFCVEGHSCFSVGAHREYREEPSVTPKESPKLVTASLGATSRNGALEFELTGGLRQPPGAVGTLRDHRTRKVLKRAVMTYDEHLAFDGWLGDRVVLRTWVEEGPGCSRWMFDPTKKWTAITDGDGVERLPECYGDPPILQASEDVLAFLPASAGSVTFIHEQTLEATSVDFGGPSTLLDTTGPWFFRMSDRVLVVAEGPPSLGDVVRVDLRERKLLGVASPRLCDRKLTTQG